jgi:thiamine kinase-like enzyme
MTPVDFKKDPQSLLVYETLKTYELINVECPYFKMWRIDAGAINRNYKVIDKHQQMLVKQLSSNQVLPINRLQTFKLQEELAILNLAPRPIFLDESETIYCEQWIDFSKPKLSQKLQCLAESLHMVHASFVSAPVVDLDVHWQTYLQSIAQVSDEMLSKYEDVLMKWNNYMQVHIDQFVLCHNDLHLDHVCFSHGPLLDWEYAGLGCRYFDIASCSLINSLSDNEHESLCALYANLANRPIHEVIEKTAIVKDCVAFTYDLWMQSTMSK